MCGENQRVVHGLFYQFGSSPRVWGKLIRHAPPPPHHRVIPTCVGKTRARPQNLRSSSGHPHVCGENCRGCTGGYLRGGSSPRVWGKRREGRDEVCEGRVIPTCVGKTKGISLFLVFSSGHPHVCGENVGGCGIYVEKDGSSPRVWGKLKTAMANDDKNRVIPTCVGKTEAGSALRKVCAGHPHVCGENPFARVGQSCVAGSSPRVWGKRQQKESERSA